MIHDWQFPLLEGDLTNRERLTSPQGSFAFERRGYIHGGVDLYVLGRAAVFTVEAGTVVGIVPFTGEPGSNAERTGRWLYTQAVLVEGASGVVVYGEVTPHSNLLPGSTVGQGIRIGYVTPVLPEGRERPDIFGHSRHMLHFEWYEKGQHSVVDWRPGQPQPPQVKDPTVPLIQAWHRGL